MKDRGRACRCAQKAFSQAVTNHRHTRDYTVRGLWSWKLQWKLCESAFDQLDSDISSLREYAAIDHALQGESCFIRLQYAVWEIIIHDFHWIIINQLKFRHFGNSSKNFNLSSSELDLEELLENFKRSILQGMTSSSKNLIV